MPILWAGTLSGSHHTVLYNSFRFHVSLPFWSAGCMFGRASRCKVRSAGRGVRYWGKIAMLPLSYYYELIQFTSSLIKSHQVPSSQVKPPAFQEGR